MKEQIRLKKVLRYVFALLFVLVSFTFNLFALYGKVVGVHDGDSFTLLDDNNVQYKIRLNGIDCPELKQAFGKTAKQFVSALIFDKYVTVETTKNDRYGRCIGIVKLANGKILNEELLKSGYAWHFLKYDKNPVWSYYEDMARKHKLGLWSEPNPIAPWDWRKSRKRRRYLNIRKLSTIMNDKPNIDERDKEIEVILGKVNRLQTIKLLNQKDDRHTLVGFGQKKQVKGLIEALLFESRYKLSDSFVLRKPPTSLIPKTFALSNTTKKNYLKQNDFTFSN